MNENVASVEFSNIKLAYPMLVLFAFCLKKDLRHFAENQFNLCKLFRSEMCIILSIV